ncbi:MAG TPA: alpha/beta fold hydrolase [Stenomitos sp.]
MTERYQDLEAIPEIADTDIAIIGMAGKFPEAQTIAEYWDNLKSGKECIKFFTTEELRNAGVPPYLLNQPNYVKATGVIEGADLFDAEFFGFSPKEAQIVDPQHRLFLEQAWTALEHGGYNPQTYPGAIGVYAGVGLNSYLLQSLYPNLLSNPNLDSYQVQIRNDKDFLPTLVAYKLNLRGPSLSIQTACSTSLVATHLACQGLLNGECDMALAGGVTVYANPTGYLYTEGMILSPDGHCRAFDAKAQGTVGGNGVGVVLLKRLADAIADHDTIYATIKGSAINNDGSAKVGYTAPSVEGQTAVIAEAQAIANTPAETISYVETHGTGTILGDPIEIAALTQAFRHSTDKVQFCALGSVKTNIGHLDTAAGVASLIKVALALHHKTIPPSLNFDTPNPAIPFAQSPFFVNTALTDWPQTTSPRRAGVSSFGIGGTNAHLVLEEAPAIPLEVSPPRRHWQMLILSAKSEVALTQQQHNLATYLRQHPGASLADVAFTLAVGRQAFGHRRVCLVQTVEDAIQTLENPKADEVFAVKADRSPVVFLFPGQGAQTLNMGRDLYDHELVFREALDQCAQLLQPHLGEDIRELLYPKGDRPNLLDQTQWAQPVLFAVEYALAQLWLHWGIEPEAMVGHSLGEYVAACIAGVFSLEDALKLIAHRARLMQQLPSGAMLAISASEAEVAQWLSDEISLAASNGAVCTVSGSIAAIAQLETQLTAAGQSVTRLNTSHAFHSPLVDPMLADFRQVLNAIHFNPPQRAYFSNVTGTWITPSEAVDPEYWIQHLRHTVRFGEAIAELLTEPNWIFLEVGLGRTLTGLVRRHPHYQGQSLLNSLSLIPNIPEAQALLSTLGQLWLRGVPCKWKRYYRGETRQRIPLPTYPFERQRYWMDPPKEGSMSSFGLSRNPDPSQWFYTPSWKQLPSLPLKTLPSGQSWLIFLDEMGLGMALAEQLTVAGQTVITVGLDGDRWRSPKAHFTLNAAEPQEYFNLLANLKSQGQFPQHILHLWSFTKPGKVDFKAESVLGQTHRGLYALLSLVQAMGKLGHFDPVQLSIITNGSYNILGTEALNPVKSTLLGALKVIPQEYPQISCRLIDLEDKTPKELTQIDWLQTLLVDLVTPDAPLEMAYRGRSRWVPCHEPMLLSEPEPKPQKLRTQGVYFITGGLGGIGLTLASYLAKTVQAKLILVSRSAFPDRRNWTNWCLTHDESDPTRNKIQQLLTLESYGAKVWVGQADATDLPSLQSLLAEAEAELGPVHGVIHCAGVADFGGIIQGRKPSDTEKILAAKVTGTLVLDQLFRDRPLDFWILSSSLSTVLYKTLFGQVGYGAANEFLSAFCSYKQQTSQTPAISIHWTEWDAVGMAVDSRAERLKNKARTQEEESWLVALTPEEGAEAFARILNQSQPQVIVCPQQLSLLLQQQAQWDANQLLESLELDLDSNQPKAPRPSLAIAYAAPQTQLEALLATQWEAYLGTAPIGLNDSFYELGGDSLLAIGLLSQLQKKLSVSIPMTVLLETPTIAGLAAYLSTQENEAIAPLLEPCTPEAQPSATESTSPLNTPSHPTDPPLHLATEPEPAMDSSSASPQQNVNHVSEASSPPVLQPAEPIAPPLPSPLIVNYRKGTLSTSPLFFIHPIGGGISCYAPLTRYLNPDWPFYSIRALGLEDSISPIDNIQTMARCYIQAIQKIQPQGPYFLGGWSMGGVVAYEMALQLIQQQQTVSGLILIDSPAPHAHERDAVDDFTTFTKGLGFFPEQVQRLSQTLRYRPTVTESLLAQLLDEGQRIGVLPRGFNVEALQQLHTVFTAHSKALGSYTAAPIRATIPSLYLEAQAIDNPLLSLFGEKARTQWKKLLGRSLMIRSLPGDHYTLVTEPHVGVLSTYINAFLGQIKPRSIVSEI